MNGKIKLLIVGAVLLVLLVSGMLLYGVLSEDYGQTDTPSDSQSTTQAADFTVVNEQREQISLSDFRGKPTVVNFWATWCGPCKSEMAAFETMYQKYGKQVNFLMVNLTDGARETVAGVSDFIQQKGYTFPVYYDTAMDAANTYRVYSIPTTLFVDQQGMLVHRYSGALNEMTLENYIQNLLGGK